MLYQFFNCYQFHLLWWKMTLKLMGTCTKSILRDHIDEVIRSHSFHHSLGFLRSRKRPLDWKKLMIFYGSQIIQNSPRHTQFISWYQEEEFHKKFIGSNITVFPIFFPITTGALWEILLDSFFHGNCSYPSISSDFNTVNVLSTIIQISSMKLYAPALIQSLLNGNSKTSFSKSVNWVKNKHKHKKIIRKKEKYFPLWLLFLISDSILEFANN